MSEPEDFKKIVFTWAYLKDCAEEGNGALASSTKGLEDMGIDVVILKRVLQGINMDDNQRATEAKYIEALKMDAV